MQLQFEDLPGVPREALPESCSSSLWRQWERVRVHTVQIPPIFVLELRLSSQSVARQRPSLLRAITYAFGEPYFWLAGCNVSIEKP